MFKFIGASVVYGLALFGLYRILEVTTIDSGKND